MVRTPLWIRTWATQDKCVLRSVSGPPLALAWYRPHRTSVFSEVFPPPPGSAHEPPRRKVFSEVCQDPLGCRYPPLYLLRATQEKCVSRSVSRTPPLWIRAWATLEKCVLRSVSEPPIPSPPPPHSGYGHGPPMRSVDK